MGGTAVRDAMAGWLAGMWPDGSDGWDLLVTVTLDRRRNAGGRGATLPPQRMTLGAGVDGDGDADLRAEDLTERVLQLGAQATLELAAGEVVGDGDDRCDVMGLYDLNTGLLAL